VCDGDGDDIRDDGDGGDGDSHGEVDDGACGDNHGNDDAVDHYMRT
jgi:hypothetical protein